MFGNGYFSALNSLSDQGFTTHRYVERFYTTRLGRYEKVKVAGTEVGLQTVRHSYFVEHDLRGREACSIPPLLPFPGSSVNYLIHIFMSSPESW